ncbi:MAG: glycine--tRNA ligase subunit beta [Candidatus Cloacimonetes bacterium]|nr:glycine--tRNA ligase subunit beta [Candidatus Cloacimonadota bacterium]
MKNNTYLYEIGTEEIPASYIRPAATYLQEYFSKKLKEAQLEFSEIKHFSTPRRLCLIITGLPPGQADSSEEIIGPPKRIAYDDKGNLNKVGLGFMKKQGLDEKDVIIKELSKGAYLSATKHFKGKSTEEILQTISIDVIPNIPFPKKMHWGNSALFFARPIRWLLALYNDNILPFEVDGIKSNNLTYGNRFQILQNNIYINNISNYISLLNEHFVIADRNERKSKIREEINAAAEKAGGYPVDDEELLETVTDLVEYPSPIIGSFNPSFLELPPKVLTTTLSETQKSFSVKNKQGELIPFFIGIGNSNPATIDKVLYGNERVINARLSDAKFYFDTDRETSLEARVPELKKVTFINNLGTLYDKITRMKSLGSWVAQSLSYDENKISRAVLLCKSDLTTLILGEKEYTKLQGYMGWQYALNDGEDPEVAQAIFEQYLPRFKNDVLPETQTGTALSLVDKMDTVTGCFSIGLQPTGTSDPLGIRRAGNGIVSILAANNISLDLVECIDQSIAAFKEADPELRDAVVEFFIQRIRMYIENKGIDYDVINAVLEAGFSDIPDTLIRAQCLQQFKTHDDFKDFIVGFKRASNILESSKKEVKLQEALLQEKEESKLYQKLLEIIPSYKTHLEDRDYVECFNDLLGLKVSIDNFFDNVMVMVEDEKLRENRMALLRLIHSTFVKTADLSKIVYEL